MNHRVWSLKIRYRKRFDKQIEYLSKILKKSLKNLHLKKKVLFIFFVTVDWFFRIIFLWRKRRWNKKYRFRHGLYHVNVTYGMFDLEQVKVSHPSILTRTGDKIVNNHESSYMNVQIRAICLMGKCFGPKLIYVRYVSKQKYTVCKKTPVKY